MQTSTSLSFFTAIFVALGGALSEELMICYRHVITELYIYRLVVLVYVYDVSLWFTRRAVWRLFAIHEHVSILHLLRSACVLSCPIYSVSCFAIHVYDICSERDTLHNAHFQHILYRILYKHDWCRSSILPK